MLCSVMQCNIAATAPVTGTAPVTCTVTVASTAVTVVYDVVLCSGPTARRRPCVFVAFFVISGWAL